MKITLSVKSKDSNDTSKWLMDEILRRFIKNVKRNIVGKNTYSYLHVNTIEVLDVSYEDDLHKLTKEEWDIFLLKNKKEILSVLKSNEINGARFASKDWGVYNANALSDFMYNNGYKYCVRKYNEKAYTGFLLKKDAEQYINAYTEYMRLRYPKDLDKAINGMKTKNL